MTWKKGLICYLFIITWWKDEKRRKRHCLLHRDWIWGNMHWYESNDVLMNFIHRSLWRFSYITLVGFVTHTYYYHIFIWFCFPSKTVINFFHTPTPDRTNEKKLMLRQYYNVKKLHYYIVYFIRLYRFVCGYL